MGGSAFTASGKPLFTPRMPRSVYEQVKTQCHAILREHYLCVASPIEGPNKSDFGDIDILVAWPKDQNLDLKEQLEHISLCLGATDAIFNGGDCSSNLAIPWPATDTTEQEKHIQVDIRVCETLQTLQWILFKHAHGDLWNVVGSTIRPYGLTVDDNALWLRIPEVENVDRKRAKIFLTSEPAEVLHFIGLPVDKQFWDRPFDTLTDMFEYVTHCAMFWIKPQKRITDETGSNGNVPTDREQLKSNDRRRMGKRPAYNKWVEEFIPACRAQGRFATARTSREEVTLRAMDRFGVRKEFYGRRKELMLQKQRDTIFTELIKGTIPQPDNSDAAAVLFRGCQVKALKKIILEGDESFGIVPCVDFMDDDGLYNLQLVADFVAKHKEDVGRAAVAIHHHNFLERKREKEGAINQSHPGGQ